jgi:hypothetical protein
VIWYAYEESSGSDGMIAPGWLSGVGSYIELQVSTLMILGTPTRSRLGCLGPNPIPTTMPRAIRTSQPSAEKSEIERNNASDLCSYSAFGRLCFNN